MKVTGYLVSAEIPPLAQIISKVTLSNKKLLSHEDSAVGISRLELEIVVRIKKKS